MILLLLALLSGGIDDRGGGSSLPYSSVHGTNPTATKIDKFGRNSDIDNAATFEDIWHGGGHYTGQDPTAAEIVTVTSSDANDTSAGTGAQTIEIFGLDGTYAPISETVILNGVALVDSTLSYIRLNRAIVRTAGSGGANAGILSIVQKVTTANVLARLPAGYNQTMIAAYTIPDGKRGQLVCWYASFGKKVASGSVEVRLLVRPPGEVWQVKEEISLSAAGTGSYSRGFPLLKGDYLGGTDIKVSGSADTNDIGVSAGFTVLISNEL